MRRVVEPRFESDNCEEHGGDQRDSHDLEVRVGPQVSIE
jgi:hypothetical protein